MLACDNCGQIARDKPKRGPLPLIVLCAKCNCAVYALVDEAGAVRYVGSSVDVERRYRYHRADATRNDKRDFVRRRGLDALRILEPCTQGELLEREAEWVDIQRLLGAPLDLLRSHRQAPDLAGRRFEAWTVLKLAKDGATQAERRWLCRCACGTVRAVREAALVHGQSRSCQRHRRYSCQPEKYTNPV